MNPRRATLALALLIGAAGCQHDATLQHVSLRQAQADAIVYSNTVPLEIDRRDWLLDTPNPAHGGGIQAYAASLYVSVPADPIHGVQISRTNLLAGCHDFALPLVWSAEPSPQPWMMEVQRETQAKMEEAPELPRAAKQPVERSLSKADNQRREYTEALRAHLYGVDRRAPDTYAHSLSPARVAASTD